MSYSDVSPFELNGSNFPGLQDIAINPGNEDVSPVGDGSSAELFHYIRPTSPSVELTTLGVIELLAAGGLPAASMPPHVALDGVNGFKAVGRVRAQDSNGYSAGNTHKEVQITHGLAVLMGISGSKDGDVSGSFTVIGRSTNGDAAVMSLSDVADPGEATSITPLVLDSVTIDGNDVPEVDDFSYSIEPALRVEHGTKLHPIHVSIAGNGPVRHRLTLNIRDESVFADLAGIGSEVQVAITCKKAAQGGTRSTAGLTIVTNAGMLVPRNLGRSQGDSSVLALEHLPRKSGATEAVTITVTP